MCVTNNNYMSAFFLIVLAYIPKHDGLSDVIRFRMILKNMG